MARLVIGDEQGWITADVATSGTALEAALEHPQAEAVIRCALLMALCALARRWRVAGSRTRTDVQLHGPHESGTARLAAHVGQPPTVHPPQAYARAPTSNPRGNLKRRAPARRLPSFGGDSPFGQNGRKMENRKRETGNLKRVNLPVLHFLFSVSCFPFLSCLVPAMPAQGGSASCPTTVSTVSAPAAH